VSNPQPAWWFIALVLLNVISLCISILALKISWERHLGLVPRSTFKLELNTSKDSNQGCFSRGWIENPLVPLSDEDESQRPMIERGRIRAYFAEPW
jgi:hypothetical protein